MPTRTLLATAALIAAVAAPSVAHADTLLRGTTDQERKVRLVVDERGKVRHARIGWHAPCTERPRFFIDGRTGFRAPFDLNRRFLFADAGTTPQVPGSGRDRGRTFNSRVRARGERVRRGVWSGSFRIRVTVRTRAGEVVDVCRMRGIRWTARRVGSLDVGVTPVD